MTTYGNAQVVKVVIMVKNGSFVHYEGQTKLQSKQELFLYLKPRGGPQSERRIIERLKRRTNRKD